MSVPSHVSIAFVTAALLALGASYNLFELIQWNLRKVEVTGTITAIEGLQADQKNVLGAPMCRGWQILHYRFANRDGKAHQGKDSVYHGDCRHSPFGHLIVYFDRNDPAQSITRTGFESRRTWAIMMGIAALIFLIVGWFWPRNRWR